MNGVAQQGLVRFAVTKLAPKKVGPNGNDYLTPSVVSYKSGEVRVGWLGTHDRDNEALTYKVFRNFRAVTDTPVYQVTAISRFDRRQPMSFVDRTAVPGPQYNYRVYVYDPDGNYTSRGAGIVTTSNGTVQTPYQRAVLDDGPSAFYRLGDAAGATTLVDTASADNAVPAGRGHLGRRGGDRLGARDRGHLRRDNERFRRRPAAPTGTERVLGRGVVQDHDQPAAGRSSATASSAPAPRVRRGTTGTSTWTMPGGCSSGPTPHPAQRSTARRPTTTVSWHHVVATLGSGGMRLYVDGASVASRTRHHRWPDIHRDVAHRGRQPEQLAEQADQQLLRGLHRRGGDLPDRAHRPTGDRSLRRQHRGGNQLPTAEFDHTVNLREVTVRRLGLR